MGFIDDVGREIARRDESASPIEDEDYEPRLAELEPGRLAVLHEFGLWTLMLLRHPDNYAAQRERLRQAVVTVGEALRTDEDWVIMNGIVRPTSFDWDDFETAYGKEDPDRYELGEDFEKSALQSYSDEQFAALLYEQARRPWPVEARVSVPDDLEPTFARRGHVDDDVMIWLYRGRAVVTTSADFGAEELLGRRTMVVENFRGSEMADDASALLDQLPDVSQLQPEERAYRALARIGPDKDDDWTFALAHDALPLPLAPEVALRREPVPEAVRHEVWRRDEGRCVLCGSQDRLEFDHMLPVSRGGSNTARNIQLLCETCNRKKGARI